MWFCNTKVGQFKIRILANGHYQSELSIDTKVLGSYAHPTDAAHAVSTRSTGFTEWDESQYPEKPTSLRDWKAIE